jgi:hypothetical protein
MISFEGDNRELGIEKGRRPKWGNAFTSNLRRGDGAFNSCRRDLFGGTSWVSESVHEMGMSNRAGRRSGRVDKG